MDHDYLTTTEDLVLSNLSCVKDPGYAASVAETREFIPLPHPEIWAEAAEYYTLHSRYPDVTYLRRKGFQPGGEPLDSDFSLTVAEDFLQTLRRSVVQQKAADKLSIGELEEAAQLIVEGTRTETSTNPVIWKPSQLGELQIPDDIIRAPQNSGTLLSKGVVGLLTGAGKLGKSTLTMQMAVKAAAPERGDDWCEVAGLQVRKGPVALIGWEDPPEWINWRLSLVCQAHGVDREGLDGSLAVIEMRDGLFGVNREKHMNTRPVPLESWDPVWDFLRDQQPVLAIIDPAGRAYMGSQNDPVGVRAFLAAVATEAKGVGCGVLIVHHSTKSERTSNARGRSAGEGAAAGSTAWTDQARCTLALTQETNDKEGTSQLRLTSHKANYASGFEIVMREITLGGKLGGFESDLILEEPEMENSASEGSFSLSEEEEDALFGKKGD